MPHYKFHRSATMLQPLIHDVNNIDYLVRMALVKGLDTLGSR